MTQWWQNTEHEAQKESDPREGNPTTGLAYCFGRVSSWRSRAGSQAESRKSPWVELWESPQRPTLPEFPGPNTRESCMETELQRSAESPLRIHSTSDECMQVRKSSNYGQRTTWKDQGSNTEHGKSYTRQDVDWVSSMLKGSKNKSYLYKDLSDR